MECAAGRVQRRGRIRFAFDSIALRFLSGSGHGVVFLQQPSSLSFKAHQDRPLTGCVRTCRFHTVSNAGGIRGGPGPGGGGDARGLSFRVGSGNAQAIAATNRVMSMAAGAGGRAATAGAGDALTAALTISLPPGG